MSRRNRKEVEFYNVFNRDGIAGITDVTDMVSQIYGKMYYSNNVKEAYPINEYAKALALSTGTIDIDTLNSQKRCNTTTTLSYEEMKKTAKSQFKPSSRMIHKLIKKGKELVDGLSIEEDDYNLASSLIHDTNFDIVYEECDLSTAPGVEYSLRGFKKKKDAWDEAMPFAK